jgi:hypothetical protein
MFFWARQFFFFFWDTERQQQVALLRGYQQRLSILQGQETVQDIAEFDTKMERVGKQTRCVCVALSRVAMSRVASRPGLWPSDV